MSRYLVLYTFHRSDKTSLHRLMRLRRMNPEVTIIPVFGVAQRISLPTLKFPKRYQDNLDWITCKSNSLFRATRVVNKTVESFRRKSQLKATADFLERLNLKLYCDFTPVGKLNQDLAIIRWFVTEGKNYDFDHMVYFEYDMFATQTIEHLYSPYSGFDAGFMGYRKATPSWLWYYRPPGGGQSVSKWLQEHHMQPTVYGSFFPGHFLSRKVLEKLAELRLPWAYCEMRLPTVVSALGFSVARLDFPKIQATAVGIPEAEIKANLEFGLFHPVYGDFDF